MIKSSILLFSLCFSLFAKTQKPYRFFNTQSYGQQDGLEVDDAINYISCDNKGFVWVCTGNGLYRFSGTLFKKIAAKKTAHFTLPGNTVRFFIQDKKGRYFLSTDGNGISVYDDDSGNFYPFELLNDTLHLNKYELGAPFVDEKNNLWVGVEHKGLICINTTDHSYKFYDTKDPVTGTHGFISTASTNSIIASKNGSILAGTNQGILILDPVTGKFINYKHDLKNITHSNGGIYEDEDGSLWMGTWAQGLLHFYPDTKKWEQYFIRPADINGTQNILNSVLYKSKDELWIGSYYGVQVFNKKEKQFYPAADIQFEVNQPGVIENVKQSRFIQGWYMIKDRDNNLWSFKQKIFSRINLSNNLFPYNIVPFGKVNNAAAFGFTRIYLDPANLGQYLLTSQFGSGLYLYNSITGRSTVPSQGTAPQLPCFINSSSLHNKQLWLCTETGLFVYDYGEKKFTPLPYKELEAVTKNKNISSIAFTDSLIWIGSSGLYQYNIITRQLRIITADAHTSLPSEGINQLFTDKNNNLWIAFGSGKNVCCIKNGTGTITDYNLNAAVNAGNGVSITQTSKGTIFFSSRGNGLYSITNPLTDKEKISLYTTANGMPSDRLHNLMCDSDDYLWLSTSNGLSICNTANMQFANFNSNNYFPQNDLYTIPTETKKGQFLLPLQYGYTIINRDSLLQLQNKDIPIAIQRFTVNGRSFKTSVDNGGDLEMPYNQNNFSLDFSALCFDDAAGINYYYHIKGLNNDTVNIFNRTNITLYALPPGNYTLQIFLKKRNKPMQQNGYELHFVIRPPFWKTWWFIMLCILLLATILYLLYRYRINQLVRLLKVRNSIAQDLHDDVGSTMTTISILSDVAKTQVEKKNNPSPLMDEIGNHARGLMEKLDDIVWSVNPQNDSFDQMALRMKRQAIDLLGNKGIKVNFMLPENPDTVILTMEKRRNIYLVFKEAIHNISKYADAKNVDIDISILKRTLLMQIKDDGNGFDINEIEKGNGLNNMQKRAKTCGGNCIIRSEKGKGSTVIFQLPV